MRSVYGKSVPWALHPCKLNARLEVGRWLATSLRARRDCSIRDVATPTIGSLLNGPSWLDTSGMDYHRTVFRLMTS